MTLHFYLATMILASSICWAVFFFVVWTINPDITNWLGFALFYVSLFLALVGTAAVIGFLIRFVGLKKELVFRSVAEAFRQSFLFAFLVITGLMLASKNLFSWLNLVLLIIGLSVLEFFLISYKKSV